MARVKVEVSYVSKNTVNLVMDDGSVYKTLHEGDAFRIDNQMRDWHVVRKAKKSGKGTILVCEKYRDNGDVLESFALPNHKVGLWATTSGSARRGVFHRYHEPVDDLDRLCADLGIYGYPKDVKDHDGYYIFCGYDCATVVLTDYNLYPQSTTEGECEGPYTFRSFPHEKEYEPGIQSYELWNCDLAHIDPHEEGTYLVFRSYEKTEVWYNGAIGRENALKALKALVG